MAPRANRPGRVVRGCRCLGMSWSQGPESHNDTARPVQHNQVLLCKKADSPGTGSALSLVLRSKRISQEREGRLGELCGGIEEDRTMTAIRYNPERGLRDGAVHVHRHFDGIEEVAIAVDDQS